MTVALVTAASDGIGLDIARELADREVDVILTAAEEDRARAAAESLWEEGLDSVRARVLDVASPASLRKLRERVGRDFGRLDVLVLVAVGADDALRVAGAFVPLMRGEPQARIVTVSPDEAVRAVTRTLATELEGSGIEVEAAWDDEARPDETVRAVVGSASG